VPNVYLERLPDPVLIIERYDRHIGNDQVISQHQIDFCQLMNKDGFFKYERNGNIIGLKEVFQQTALFVTPGVARLRLVDWVIFNYLIGNTDAHAKNLSALLSAKGLELAPVYDLLSVTPYGDERLALYIGYAETFEAVTSVAWAEFCEDCQLSLPAFRKRLSFLSSRIGKAFETEVAALGPLPDEEASMVNRIQAEISRFSGYARQSLS
jgi:serine/threonine-protein kinase HipA